MQARVGNDEFYRARLYELLDIFAAHGEGYRIPGIAEYASGYDASIAIWVSNECNATIARRHWRCSLWHVA